VSAQDCPPGMSLSALARHEFAAKTYAKRLAWLIFAAVLFVSGATIYFIGKNMYMDQASVFLAGPLFCFLVAGLGVLIRSAKLRFFTDRIQWSLPYFEFSLPVAKLSKVVAYGQTIAFEPRKGSTWFISDRDWNEFNKVPDALASCGFEVESKTDEPIPWKARVQSYGLVLDGLLVVNLLACIGLLFIVMNLNGK